jgi:hypothetical protein
LNTVQSITDNGKGNAEVGVGKPPSATDPFVVAAPTAAAAITCVNVRRSIPASILLTVN